MAVTVSQYFGATHVTKDVASTAYKRKAHIVHVINNGSDTVDCVGKKSYITKVKCVGTVFDWVKVDLYDLQGDLLIAGVVLDESDEIVGPFGKVKFSSTQTIDGTAQTTTEPLQALVWEYING